MALAVSFGLSRHTPARSSDFVRRQKARIAVLRIVREQAAQVGVRFTDVAVIRRSTSPEAALSLRTNGVALPGLKSGWFCLIDGSRALVWITSDEALHLTTRSGQALLLSAAHPAQARTALIARIRAAQS